MKTTNMKSYSKGTTKDNNEILRQLQQNKLIAKCFIKDGRVYYETKY